MGYGTVGQGENVIMNWNNELAIRAAPEVYPIATNVFDYMTI